MALTEQAGERAPRVDDGVGVVDHEELVPFSLPELIDGIGQVVDVADEPIDRTVAQRGTAQRHGRDACFGRVPSHNPYDVGQHCRLARPRRTGDEGDVTATEPEAARLEVRVPEA